MFKIAKMRNVLLEVFKILVGKYYLGILHYMKLFIFLFLIINIKAISSIHASSVVITKEKNIYVVQANFKTFTDICTTWNVITDYENLHSFLPKIVKSEVLNDLGNQKVVSQVFKEDFLFLDFYLESEFIINEYPKKRKIVVKQISGDLQNYKASWDLVKKENGSIVKIFAKITPTKFQSLLFSNRKVFEQFGIMIDSLKKKLNKIEIQDDCKY